MDKENENTRRWASNNLLVGTARADPIWEDALKLNFYHFNKACGSSGCPTAVR